MFSAFHKVKNNEEIWAIHLGRLLVHVLEPDGSHRILRLGLEFESGERPVVTVPTGLWQAAEIGLVLIQENFLWLPFEGLTAGSVPCGSFSSHDDSTQRIPKRENTSPRLTPSRSSFRAVFSPETFSFAWRIIFGACAWGITTHPSSSPSM